MKFYTTVDSFIFVGINFRGWMKKCQLVDSEIRGFEVSSIHDNVKFPVRGGSIFVGQCHPRKPRKLINETTVYG